jgi:hypothetical protein
MKKSAFRRFAIPLIAAVAAVGLAGTSATAAIIDPAPIGPNQFFHGDVNGLSANATITTDCVGPVRPNESGHPVGNQYVDVLPGVSSGSAVSVGFTGSAGNSVRAALLLPISSGPASGIVLGTLRDYVVRLTIPVDITVPCNGSADVVFTPLPTSDTAKSATVHVTLVSIGV